MPSQNPDPRQNLDPRKNSKALLGKHLRRLRLAAGFTTQAAAAARIDGYGEDSLQKAETGGQVPSHDLYAKLLDLYEATDLDRMYLDDLLEQARQGKQSAIPEFAEPWLAAEKADDGPRGSHDRRQGGDPQGRRLVPGDPRAGRAGTRVADGPYGGEITLGEPAVNPGWRKSSYSNGGTNNCVEVGTWRKSSHSNGGSGGCVEVGTTATVVLVRDTTNRAGAVLAIPAAAWRALLTEIRA